MDIPIIAYPLVFCRQRVKSSTAEGSGSIAIDFTDARILPKTLTLPLALSFLLSTLTSFSASLLSHCMGCKSILKLTVGLSCRARLIDQTSESIWQSLIRCLIPAQTHLFAHSQFCWHTCCEPGGKFCAFSKSRSGGANKAPILFHHVGASYVKYCTSLYDHA